MKIAIVGTGIAGNVLAYRLRRQHDITVFESASYPGGHSNTVNVLDGDRALAIDTGFIVYNERTYPNFTRLLDEIGQATRDSNMSFSVQADGGRVEYAGSSLSSLFAQRRNLLRPAFLGMVGDILRFNRVASSDAAGSPARLESSLGDYLAGLGFGPAFIDHYLVPMTAAIWSAAPSQVFDMPARFLVRFFANHGLLQLRDRPQWKVIDGGSREYVSKLVNGHRDRIRLDCPVRSIRRLPGLVEIDSGAGREHYDCVFLACHADQALAALSDPTATEQSVLSAFGFQSNEAVLHTDVSLLPRHRRAWAAWNYHASNAGAAHVSVTYNMNILQSLPVGTQYLVTLNPSQRIDTGRVIRRFQYDHPVLDQRAVRAQDRHAEVNGDRTFFCGAYWRNGFHEDGVASALAAIQHFEDSYCYEQHHLRRAG